jgi:Leucine-rich repeat (LRR) protein
MATNAKSMMNDRIKLEDRDYGRRAVIVAPWSDDMVRFLVDNQIAELELNQGKGWQGSGLKFLAELPQLRSLIIIDFTISSVEPIHYLHELRALDLITYCKTEIRLSAFPRLEDCGLEWRPRATSLFDCTTLKKLFVNHYKGKNADSFSTLVNLESLAILNAPIEDLRGLSALAKLRSLRLANLKGLPSLSGIEQLINLEILDIDSCKRITTIEEIGFLHRLRRLFLNNGGKIESLQPLAKLRTLEWIGFCESTNIMDGDLSPLLNQTKLERVSFQNRRHYSHRREAFPPANKG